jgi:DNA-directed RNA polymerase specialized sigma24 family protein
MDMAATIAEPSPMEWTGEVDRRLRGVVQRVCDRAAEAAARTAAWRELMVELSPHVEGWARRSRTLRRCRLAGDDDARTVLVDVLRRLAAHDHEALRAFLERRPPTAADEQERDEASAIERIAALLGGEADDEEAEPVDTPLRAWVLRIVDFAAKDHVRARLGGGEQDKRALGTDAQRLDAAPEPAARPPLTDLVTLRKVLAEIREAIAGFPAQMQRALALWVEDERFDAIARELGLDGPDRARELVRAATARLRDRFRARFPSLVAP